jgi:hypothetical protein
VPLLLAGPGVPRGETRDAVGSLADVAPTLRALARLDARPGDGRSLLAPAGSRIVCGESLYANRLYGWAQQSTATDGRFTLVDGGPRLGLFDRAADPGERAPLPDPTGHEAYARLDRALLDYRARRAGPEGEPFAATPIYGTNRIAESDFSPPKENRGRRDVEEGFGTIARLNEVQRLIVLRSAAALAMLLPEIEREEAADPANPAFPLARGRALLLVLDRPGEAVAALEKAARLGYASPDLARMIEAARERAR